MPILIEPWRISEDGLDIEGQEPSTMLALEPSSQIQPEGPLLYALRIQYVTHELIVSGELSIPVRFACSRCAESTLVEVREPAFFAEHEVENLHDTVDLTDEVRESIILAFPSYPLCKSDCQGLCTRCGANLNKERCGCKQPTKEQWTAFSGLDQIEVKNGRTQKEEIEE